MIRNYRIENTLELIYFPCVEQIYLRAISICLESKYKRQNISKTRFEFSRVLFGNHSFRESTLERFWETYSEAVLRVMNILFVLTILIDLKIINSGYCLDIKPNSQNKDQVT